MSLVLVKEFWKSIPDRWPLIGSAQRVFSLTEKEIDQYHLLIIEAMEENTKSLAEAVGQMRYAVDKFKQAYAETDMDYLDSIMNTDISGMPPMLPIPEKWFGETGFLILSEDIDDNANSMEYSFLFLLSAEDKKNPSLVRTSLQPMHQTVGFFSSSHVPAKLIRLVDHTFQIVHTEHIRGQAEEHIMIAVVVFVQHPGQQGFLCPLL